MKANFIVSEQMLVRATNEQKMKLASHNKKIIAAFELRTKEWQTAPVYALFTHKDRTWKKILGAEDGIEANECYIPSEVLRPGHFTITLYCDDRYVTLPCRVDVIDSGYTEVIENEQITPSVMEQMNSFMKKYALICNNILQDCVKIKEEITKEE